MEEHRPLPGLGQPLLRRLLGRLLWPVLLRLFPGDLPLGQHLPQWEQRLGAIFIGNQTGILTIGSDDTVPMFPVAIAPAAEISPDGIENIPILRFLLGKLLQYLRKKRGGTAATGKEVEFVFRPGHGDIK